MNAAEIETLRRQDAYYWRLLGTGLSFAVFGLAGVLLGVLVFPLLRLLPGAPSARQARARAVIRACMRLFVGLMSGMRVISYEFTGAERLGRPGQLIVANHPSLIDVVFLIGFTPSAGCVVKQELWRNPFTRGVVSAARYCSNASTGQMVDESEAALAEGQTLIMFPEGTRSRPGHPMALYRGAAYVAVKAARIVTPVFISVSPPTLTKAEPWHHIADRRAHFRFRVGDDLDPSEFAMLGAAPIASRKLHERLRETFEKELVRSGA